MSEEINPSLWQDAREAAAADTRGSIGHLFA